MANSNETTTKLSVDISELKRGLQEAGRQIKLANSEFKAASAGMDDWSKSSEGLESKINQLNSILDAQKKALGILQQQYDATVQAEGATSKAAEELKIKLNNQKAAIGNTEKQLRNYNTKLDDCRTAAQELAQEQTDTANSFDKLKGKVSDQEKELADLKDEYANLVIEQGKESEAAKECANKISALSDDLTENRNKLNDATGAADDLTSSFNDTDTASDNVSDGFTIMKGALADLAADGIRACIDAFKDFVTETQTAYNDFQAETGTAADKMGEFKDAIDDLYKNAYGDSLNDIADVMAEIKNQTGEVDASKLKELSENAMTMRDTFDFDIPESIRAVNMLMEQFGLSGDEAFGLIAKGAQNGLNKNGDLLDTINEYSSYYAAQGYSAEEFYNSLKNGSEAGTFSVDKLGDAMKEFGIRSKDTADTTTEGFQLIGYGVAATTEEMDKQKDKVAELEKKLSYAKKEQSGFNDKTSELKKQKMDDTIKKYSDELETAKGKLGEMEESTKGNITTADDMRDAFSQGGETARKATKEVLKKLLEMDDKVKQNQAGVDLFGTMWEDLGIEGVKALMNVEGELGDTKKTMEDIKKVKYDDVNTQLTTLGRTAKQELLVPLAEKLIPKVTEFVNWSIEHFNEIIPILEGIGAALITAFAVQKIGAFVVGINGIVTAVKAWTVATEAQTVAQKLLSIATSATPWGIAATAVGLLVGGIVAWTAATDDQTTSEAELYAEIDETNKRLADNKKAYDEAAQARDDAVADTSGEFNYYKQLKDELDGIVDKNGKVKKGYEERAAFIVSTLSEATGQEITMNGNVVESYNEISKSIDDLLIKKQAEAQLANYEESYNTAITNRTQAYNDLVKAQDNYKTVSNDLKDAKDKLAEAEDGVRDAAGGSDMAIQMANSTLINATGEVSRLEQKQKEANKAITDAQSVFTGYQDTIKNYEGVSAAIIEGDTTKIKSSLDNLTNNFVNTENGTKTSLENQVKNMKKTYENLKKAVDENAPGVTQEMVENAAEMVHKANTELSKFEAQAEQEGKDAGDGATRGLWSKVTNFEEAAKGMARQGQFGLSFYDYNQTGQKEGGDFVSGIQAKNAFSMLAGKGLANKGKEGAGSIDLTNTGSNSALGFTRGISSKNSNSYDAGENLADEAKDGAASVDATDTGSMFSEGFMNGMSSWGQTIGLSASSMVTGALNSMKRAAEEHSPSKATKRIGAYFSQGFANGIIDKAKVAINAAKELVNDALTPLNSASVDIEGGIRTASAATSGANSSVSNTTNNSSVTNNFYQTNNSPQPLSRLEIYRQSKNLLSAKGG